MNCPSEPHASPIEKVIVRVSDIVDNYTTLCDCVVKEITANKEQQEQSREQQINVMRGGGVAMVKNGEKW